MTIEGGIKSDEFFPYFSKDCTRKTVKLGNIENIKGKGVGT